MLFADIVLFIIFFLTFFFAGFHFDGKLESK